MIIKILGTGCPKCKLLQKTVEESAQKLGLKCEIQKIDDMADILQYDVMSLPGLVIDEKVVMTGRVPEPEEIINILTHQKLSQDFVEGKCCKGNC